MWGATRYLHVGYYNSRVISELQYDIADHSDSDFEPEIEVEADRREDRVRFLQPASSQAPRLAEARDITVAITWPADGRPNLPDEVLCD